MNSPAGDRRCVVIAVDGQVGEMGRVFSWWGGRGREVRRGFEGGEGGEKSSLEGG